VIFVDSNLPMYLVGAPHPNKLAAEAAVQRLVLDDERLVTDADVLQEILHRYTAIHRLEAIEPAFQALLGLVDEVFPVTLADAEAARDLVIASETLSARDALHVAVMKREGVRQILTFDRGFDEVSGLERLPGG
jgi:uncharacterized protein